MHSLDKDNAMRPLTSGFLAQTPADMVGHVASTFAIVGAFVGLLPSLAAGIAILWYAVQIYESKSVQGWMKKRRRKKALRRRKRRERWGRISGRD